MAKKFKDYTNNPAPPSSSIFLFGDPLGTLSETHTYGQFVNKIDTNIENFIVAYTARDVLPITTNGQTAFNLTRPYLETSDPTLNICYNGINYSTPSVDYNLVVLGGALTWLEPDGISLVSGENLIVTYYVEPV